MNFLNLEERDITDLVTTYESKRDATIRITFGLTVTRRLKELLHWVQDQHRCRSPTITSDVTISLLTQALQQASARKSFILKKEVNTKIAKFRKFSKESTWKTWRDAFINYISVLPGTSSIPLVYIVRPNFYLSQYVQ